MYPGAYVDRFPDKPAVLIDGTDDCLTFGQLDDRSRRLAHYLFDLGLRRGDHIAVLTGNTTTTYEVYWAAVRSGLYVTAVNRHLAPSEVSYIVDNCQARVLIVSAAVGELALAVVAGTPRVQWRLVFGAGDASLAGHEDYERAVANASDEPLPSEPRGADMLYSSGTTGRPKGVRLPLPDRQVGEPGETITTVYAPRYGFDADTVYLSPAPVYHAAPLRFGAAVQALGGTVVMLSRFDAEAALAAIERHRITHSQWVPTMFVRMLKLDDASRARYDLSSMRVAIHGAAPCPVEVKRAMIEWWGPILEEYYSSTESIGATFINSAQWLVKPGSVGPAVIGTIRICDDGGAVLPVGEVGTVYFERDIPLFSYHGDPAKTRDSRHPAHENWATNGDIGYLDDDDYLFLTDRKAFMIISGGVNIYPQEIEDALALHPKVLDAAVIGIPDPEMGEAVKGIILPTPGVDPGPALAEELRTFLRTRIAHYKVPSSFDFVDDLPRTPTGKLVKGGLRDRYAAESAQRDKVS